MTGLSHMKLVNSMVPAGMKLEINHQMDFLEIYCKEKP